MWQSSETISLPDNIFTILRELIHERTGIYYDNAKRELVAEKLSGHVADRGLGSFLDYYYLLKYGPDADLEWPRVMDALSVQETYFWREVVQINALVNDFIPLYLETSRSDSIQIWSAACASGEEPLTVAMVLEEAGWFNRANIRIVGTDASPAAIAKARRGIYRERSFRAIPKHLQDKYFKQVPDGWRICPDLAARVSFSQANLVQPGTISNFAAVPFILCRNVFIYFSSDAIRRTVAEFAKRMNRPGYLFVGASESLLRLTTDFELQPAGDAFVYRLQ